MQNVTKDDVKRGYCRSLGMLDIAESAVNSASLRSGSPFIDNDERLAINQELATIRLAISKVNGRIANMIRDNL